MVFCRSVPCVPFFLSVVGAILYPFAKHRWGVPCNCEYKTWRSFLSLISPGHLALTLELDVREMTNCVNWWKVGLFYSIQKDTSRLFFRFSQCVDMIPWIGKATQVFSAGICHTGLQTGFFFSFINLRITGYLSKNNTWYTYRRVPISGEIGKNKAKVLQWYCVCVCVCVCVLVSW